MNAFYSKISHNGLNDNESTNPNNKGGLSFSTKLVGAGLRIEKNFFNNRYFKLQSRSVQLSIFTGLEFINFNPTGQAQTSETIYNLVDLRDPADSTFKPYSTTTLGIPLEIKVRWQVNAKFSTVVYFSYHITFSPILDDVSYESYPDYTKYTNFLISKGYTNPVERAAINSIRGLLKIHILMNNNII